MTKHLLLVLLVLASARASLAASPFEFTLEVDSSSAIPDLGTLAAGQGMTGTTGNPFEVLRVNNNGDWVMRVRTTTSTPGISGIVTSDAPLSAYLAMGISAASFPDAATGVLSAPSSDHAPLSFHDVAVNDAQDIALIMTVGPGEFGPPVPTTSGVFLGRDKLVIEEGDASLADFGEPTTWSNFDANSLVYLNNADQLLIVSDVSGVSGDRRAAVIVNLDSAGNRIGATLIAVEGAAVGSTGETWSQLATSPHAFAFNDTSDALVAGTFNGGGSGVFRAATDSIVAHEGTQAGDTTLTWLGLEEASVDLSNAGEFVVRGSGTSDASGTWNEGAVDAAEVPLNLFAQDTIGAGALTTITGTLDDDHDVDLFRIFIDDEANFSATTVPAPGFDGASFDTVLTLFGDPGNNNTRGITRNDDAAPGVPQSTITGSALNINDANGERVRFFLLGVATRESEATGQAIFPMLDDAVVSGQLWERSPAGLAVHDGRLYWNDRSSGSIRSIGVDGSSEASVIDVGPRSAASVVVADDAVDRIFWADPDTASIHSARLDGTDETVLSLSFGGTDITGLAIDNTQSPPKVYFARNQSTFVIRVNSDGSMEEGRVAGIGVNADNPDPTRLAVDPVGGKVYWTSPANERIERADVAGVNQNVETFVSNVSASDIAICESSGMLYWCEPDANQISRVPLAGGASEVFVNTEEPIGLAIDQTTSTVYWTAPSLSLIRRASATTGVVEDVTTIENRTGERVTDGSTSTSPLLAWTRRGTSTPGALAYEVRLTGATFSKQGTSLIVRNGTDVVAIEGDSPLDISPNVLRDVGTGGGSSSRDPVWISDSGRVVWKGTWLAPANTTSGFGIRTGLFNDVSLFLNDTDTFAESEETPPAPLPGNISLWPGARQFSLSDNGTYLFARVQAFNQFPLAPFDFRDWAILGVFGCLCEFDGDTASVAIGDLLAFLALWFSLDTAADIDGSPGVTITDLLEFLACWFDASATGVCN